MISTEARSRADRRILQIELHVAMIPLRELYWRRHWTITRVAAYHHTDICPCFTEPGMHYNSIGRRRRTSFAFLSTTLAALLCAIPARAQSAKSVAAAPSPAP